MFKIIHDAYKHPFNKPKYEAAQAALQYELEDTSSVFIVDIKPVHSGRRLTGYTVQYTAEECPQVKFNDVFHRLQASQPQADAEDLLIQAKDEVIQHISSFFKVEVA